MYSITRVVAFDTEILLTDVILNRILRENKIKIIYIKIKKPNTKQQQLEEVHYKSLRINARVILLHLF
jgi:hypothetical protein